MRRSPALLDGICELTLRQDPDGNVVEVWDFFQREPEGVDALAG